MTEPGTAIQQARELEDRVKQLYCQALASDAGLVTLKLLFSGIELPRKGANKYKGRLAAAIAKVVIPFDPATEWSVWLKRKKGSKINVKIKVYDLTPMPGAEEVPLSFDSEYYYIFSNPGDMPF